MEPTFDQRVYAMVALIPSGQLATYSQIAELIGAWGCARQVGWALRRLPLPSDLPWHRVVNAQGRISLSLAREGSDWIQAELLRDEGIPVDGEGRLPLRAHRWQGPSPLALTGASAACGARTEILLVTPLGSSSAPQHAAGLAPRRLAWAVLQAVAAGAYADAALERALGRAELSTRDRALATDLAYGAIRQRALLDGWITAKGRVAAQRQPPKLRWLLHVGLYQLLFLQRVPPSAAVSTTVQLAREGGLERLAPVVNGLLRGVLRSREGLPADAEPWRGLPLPEDAATALALRHSLPPWLAQDLLRWRGPGEAEVFAQACNAPPPLDLRVNTLRTDPATLIAHLAEAGVRAEALPELPEGLTLLDRPGDLRALPGYAQGHWSVQDRQAQRIAPLLDPQPGERILDACAAPGGKATHCAERMGDRGEVWAVDRSAARLKRLSANAERLGLQCLRPLAAEATTLLAQQPGWRKHFDRILLDAPCSGLGTLARHADARWRQTSATVAELAALQDALLEGLAPLLAPGGRFVYATCTVHPRENQERIVLALQHNRQWLLLQEQQWWPQVGGGDGFYAAVLADQGEGGGGGGGGEMGGGTGGGGAAGGMGAGATAAGPGMAGASAEEGGGGLDVGGAAGSAGSV